MEQLERIICMEQILDESQQAVEAAVAALERYMAVKGRMDELFDYYTSRQWLADYDDDNAGMLPRNLSRRVLSQDAVYDLISENRQLQELLKLAKDDRR